MEPIPEEKQTNHARWFLGAVLLFIPIPVLMSLNQDRKTRGEESAPLEVSPLRPAPSVSTESGPLTCGQCNGDGRIDDQDRSRRVPATTAASGDCPYCGSGRAASSSPR